ncbi:MAG TPA: DEAD/DEAH box helicase, partial [Cellvibrionaceae bacterium]|nr:DEAD/DEAH box helicase [Cellvibrionaceae bacterium]
MSKSSRPKPAKPKPAKNTASKQTPVSPLERDVLYSFALAHSLTSTELMRLLQHLKIANKSSAQQLNEAVARLLKLNLLVKTSGYPHKISFGGLSAALADLLFRGGHLPWISALRAVFPIQPRGNPFLQLSTLTCWREYAWATFEGQYEAAIDWRALFNDRNDAQGFPLLGEALLVNGPYGQLLASQPPAIQALLLDEVFARSIATLGPCTHAYDFARAHLTELMAYPDDLEYLCLLALLRADETTFTRLHSALAPWQQLCGQACLSLLKGQYAEAFALFTEHIKQRKKIHKGTKYLPGIWGYMYCLAALGTNTSESLAALATQVQQGIKQRRAAYNLLEPLVAQLQGGHAIAPIIGSIGSINLNQFSGLIQLLVIIWRQANIGDEGSARLSGHVQSLHTLGYQWLAAEFDAINTLHFKAPAVLPGWHAQRQRLPLFKALPQEETWQRALTALTKLQRSGSSEGDTRLVWWLRWLSGELAIEPREQKCSAKGVWSKGRPIALKRLYQGDATAGMSSQDARVIDCIERNRDYYYEEYVLNLAKALPLLVNHPALYWQEAPEVRVELVAGEISLQLQEKPNEIELRLEPSIDSGLPFTLHKITPTRIALYSISSEIKQIASVIGNGLSVPSAAKEQLVAALKAIAPHISIHSDLPELSAQIPSQPADATLYAHLLPLNEGLRLQFLQRPLSEGSWFLPGRGPANVVGEVAGAPIQAVRDLSAEKTHLGQILAACPSLAEAQQMEDQPEWHLEHPEACLELLSELKARPEVTLVWPQGERLRIKGNRSLSNLSLSVKKKGEWFEADGTISLDDGRVMALRELLQLASTSTGRFLKLGESDYLALTNSLRKRLQELNAFAETTGKGGLRINPLAAPALAELAREVGSLEADDAWRQQVASLDALADFQPKVPSTLQAQLRDYQLQGFQWLARLARWGVGACLADDMGLGKTVQTLALLLSRARGGPALVVAPLSVAMNWLSEAQKFAPTLSMRSHNTQRDLSQLGAFDVVVTSYGLLQQDAEQFAKPHWHTIVLDEAQAIKNANTKRSQAAMALQGDFKMLASGTPVENHLGELWNLFRFINPGLLGSKERFSERFANPIENGNLDARNHLKKLIQPFILRRTKTQVLSELPPRTEITLQVELSEAEQHLYEALRQQAVDSIATAKAKPLQVLAEITKLRRFCCNPKLVVKNTTIGASKMAVFAETLTEILANQHKALVFSQFVDHLSLVREYLDAQQIHYQYLDGATSAPERKKRVDNFQAG